MSAKSDASMPTADNHNNTNEEKKMGNEIQSYMVKKNTVVKVIRFDDPSDFDSGHFYVDEWVTEGMFGFNQSYLVATFECVCCGEVSYVFDHNYCGFVEINGKDLILTELSIAEFCAEHYSEDHNAMRGRADDNAA